MKHFWPSHFTCGGGNTSLRWTSEWWKGWYKIVHFQFLLYFNSWVHCVGFVLCLLLYLPLISNEKAQLAYIYTGDSFARDYTNLSSKKPYLYVHPFRLYLLFRTITYRGGFELHFWHWHCHPASRVAVWWKGTLLAWYDSVFLTEQIFRVELGTNLPSRAWKSELYFGCSSLD